MRRRSAAARAALAALAFTLLACAEGNDRPTRNLILITMDTTRADRLHCYGNDDIGTPNIDRVAEQGTLFRRAFATAPITGPSHASILSGTYPPFHQVRDNSATRVPEELPWMAEIFGRNGFRTAGIIAAYPLKSVFGFGRAFDYFSDVLSAPPGALMITNEHTIGVASRHGEAVSREFVRWLDRYPDGPFFVWLHYYDPHWPYEPGAGYGDIYPDDLYNAEIAYMDDSIGAVLEAVERHGLADRTGVVLVADHGEGLMDHGELTHALLAYNSTLHVPLVCFFPWLDQRPEVTTAVSTVDILPTVMEALAVDDQEVLGSIQGRSLMPVLSAGSTTPSTPEPPLYFETYYPYYHYGWGTLRGIIDGRWKYIRGPDEELYDLETDFGETQPLDNLEAMSAMQSTLERMDRELRAGRPQPYTVERTRETTEMLRALGYLGDAGMENIDQIDNLEDLAIPRDNMDAFFAHNEVLGLLQENKLQEAILASKEFVERYPSHTDAKMLLANLYLGVQAWEAADAVFNEVMLDDPDADTLRQLGRYQLSRDRLDVATECFERVLAAAPTDFESVTALASIKARRGQIELAMELYEQALSIDPKAREALIGLAVLLDRQHSGAAGEYFDRAISTYPFDPRVNYDYGVYLLRSGEEHRGVEHLEMASAFSDASFFEPAHFALAEYFARSGSVEEARRHLREIVLVTDNPESLERATSMLQMLE